MFGSIIVQCSEPEVKHRYISDLNGIHFFISFSLDSWTRLRSVPNVWQVKTTERETFSPNGRCSDTSFRDEHRVQSEFIKTFTQIAPHAESRLREDFILPFLASIASQNSQQQSERGPAKRLEISTYLFEAYSALSCCSHSGQAILNSFLPGLYCLRVDFAQLRPDSVAVLDSIIKELEHKLEQHRQDRWVHLDSLKISYRWSVSSSSLMIAGTNLNQENIRGRMLKGLTTFRDSTEKLTYRFMKKKWTVTNLSVDDQMQLNHIFFLSFHQSFSRMTFSLMNVFRYQIIFFFFFFSAVHVDDDFIFFLSDESEFLLQTKLTTMKDFSFRQSFIDFYWWERITAFCEDGSMSIAKVKIRWKTEVTKGIIDRQVKIHSKENWRGWRKVSTHRYC